MVNTGWRVCPKDLEPMLLNLVMTYGAGVCLHAHMGMEWGREAGRQSYEKEGGKKKEVVRTGAVLS